MKLPLDVNQQYALFAAMNQMDGHDVLTGAQTVRVPYVLKSERRTLLKNLKALQASLAIFEEARSAVETEVWPAGRPQAPDDADMQRFAVALADMAAKKDEIDLDAFSENAIWNDNEFPIVVSATLDQFGLIAAPTAA